MKSKTKTKPKSKSGSAKSKKKAALPSKQQNPVKRKSLVSGQKKKPKKPAELRTLNRLVALVSFKQEFVDWVNQLPDLESTLFTLEMLNHDKPAYLIPTFTDKLEAEEWFAPHKGLILEDAFRSISADTGHWPEDHSENVFDLYLSTEMHSMLWDLVDDEPIQAEESQELEEA